MEKLSEYVGSNRSANINLSAYGYEVDLYEDNALVETRKVHDKSLSYAEDVADNWVSGIINL